MKDETEISNNILTEDFKINSIRMKDGKDGKVLWETKKYSLQDINTTEEIPKDILNCKEVIREINFSSKSMINDLELVQNFYLNGELIETNRFYFGFVIPHSTNNWEQVIEAKAPEEMIPVEILSGNLLVEVLFLAKGEVIARSCSRIYYV